MYCIYPKNYLVVVVLVLVVLVVIIMMKMMNDSIIVDMYVNVYIYPSASYISISIPYPYPFLSLPTYLPTKRSLILILSTKKNKLHRSLFLIPLSPSHSRVRVCTVYIYELMEGFSSLSYPVRTSPRPSAPLPPKKKKTFASAASPPPPYVMVHHTYSHN